MQLPPLLWPALHLPRRISEEGPVIFGEESFDRSALVAEAKRDTMTRIARCVVGPREDDVPQSL